MLKNKLVLPIFSLLTFTFITAFTDLSDGNYKAPFAVKIPVIDGLENDGCWSKANWKGIDHLWLGALFSETDFRGKYKAVWAGDKIYLLVEVIDDSLTDSHADGLKSYWDDDCVEVFIDENKSGGNHQYNYNAFAYHVALDYKVTDIGPDSLPHFYNDHVTTRRTKKGNTYTWELAISVYSDNYNEKSKTNKTVQLKAGKKMGFALAYCDNDKSESRENFIGTIEVKGADKNRGWIDAGIFGTMELGK